MDDTQNSELDAQKDQIVNPNDVVNLNVVSSTPDSAPQEVPPAQESPLLESVDVLPESDPVLPKATEDNIIFTPEDYQKMTGEPAEDGWQPVTQPVMPPVETPAEVPSEPMASPTQAMPEPSVQPESAPVVEPQTVFAPVPAEATEHYEEPVSNIPNPESFYVGYKPAPPVQAAPTGLEKRINQVSAEQAAKNKKLIITVVAVVVSTLLVAGGGIFGYVAYQKSASKKILTTAWQNLTKATDVSTKISLGYDGSDIEATLDVDKDSDMRFKLDVREFPIELVYINKSDKLYVYDIAATTESATTTTSTKSWIEVSNTKKGITSYTEKAKITEQIDLSSYTTGDNAKYFKKEANEIVDGVDSYKFVYAPPSEVMDSAISQIKEQDTFKDLGIKASDFKVEMWIGKKDNKFTKIKATAGFDFNLEESEKNYTGNLELKFKYDFKEDIKTTARTKVSQKIDLSKELEGLIQSSSIFGGQGGGDVNSADEANIAMARQLQNALEQYFVDNNKYPSSETANELVSVLADQNLIDADLDFSEFKYTHTATPEGYMIMFKLADQEYSGDNTIGESPDKYYALTAKQ